MCYIYQYHVSVFFATVKEGDKQAMVTRKELLEYADENYNTQSEHLWAKYPSYEVLRHNSNRKWYAVIMDIPGNKVGLDGEELIDILDVKCEPDMVPLLSSQKGFCEAYHMNKKHWITIVLDGTAADEEIYNLLDMSYELTK